MQVRTLAASAVVGLLVLTSNAAHAQQQPPPPPSSFLPEEERPGVAKPYADDDRTGSLWLTAGGNLNATLGGLATGVAVDDYASVGPGLTVGLGLGVARYLSLDVEGSFTSLGPAGRCETCSTTQLSGGLGLSYHLAQAFAFDPWVRFGVGFRSLELLGAGEVDVDSTDGSPSAVAILDGTYLGFDVAQLRLGADFEPVRGFSFGPWMGLDVGATVAQPDDTLLGHPAYASLTVGIRASIEPLPWVGADPASESRAGQARASFSAPAREVSTARALPLSWGANGLP